MPADPGQPVDVHLSVTGVAGCVATLLGPGTGNVLATAAAVDDTITLDVQVVEPAVRPRRGPPRRRTMVALTNPIFLAPVG